MDFVKEHLPKAIYVVGTSYGLLYSGVMLNSSIFLIPALTAPEKTPSQKLNSAQIMYVMDCIGSKSTTGTFVSAVVTSGAILGSAYLQHTSQLQLSSPNAFKLLLTGGLLAVACLPYNNVFLKPCASKITEMDQEVQRNEKGLREVDRSEARKQKAVDYLQTWAKWNYGKVALCFGGALLSLLAAL